MPSDPIIIISGTDDDGPANPVRILNWTQFVNAVAAQLGIAPIVDRIDFNTAYPTPAFLAGRLYWDQLEKTLSLMQLGGASQVIQQIGQEVQTYVRNESGVDIPDGSALYINGTAGNRPSVVMAKADGLFTSIVHCVSTQPIPKNTFGYVTTFGIIRNIDTQTPGWNEGDFLYLSDTVAGGMRNSPPPSGYSVLIGLVLKRSVGDGMIQVCPQYINYFGSVLAGHYTDFRFDGTMQAHGNATCWLDELQPLTGARITSPSSDFVINDAEVSVTAKSSARYPTDFISTNLQLNHDWTLGTVISPHLHWWQPSANMPNWLIGHRWQKQGSAKTTAWTLDAWSSNIFVWSAGLLCQITEFPDITPPVGYGQVSDIIQFKLWRDVTNVSAKFPGPEAAPVDKELLHFDIHKNVDMLGSKEEFVK